jgi:nucleotide-binding universal stress UspA family protein
MLDQALEVLSFAYPDLAVRVRLESGPAVAVLVEESRRADTVVVGCRGTGGFANLLLGSTTLRLASKVHCPLVAVPAVEVSDDARRAVVVGADGSEGSERALAYGFRVAAETGATLVAVRVWNDVPQVATGLRVPVLHDSADIEQSHAAALSQQVEPWAEKHPQVSVEQVVKRGHVARTLLNRAAEASLLVVGSRGRGDLHSALLGSVSHAVLHHTSVPVAVVPPDA